VSDFGFSSNRRFPVVILAFIEVRRVKGQCPLPITVARDRPAAAYAKRHEKRAGDMNGRSDIEHVQELVLGLSPENAELINSGRGAYWFMLAGTRRPNSREAIEHAVDRGGE